MIQVFAPDFLPGGYVTIKCGSKTTIEKLRGMVSEKLAKKRAKNKENAAKEFANYRLALTDKAICCESCGTPEFIPDSSQVGEVFDNPLNLVAGALRVFFLRAVKVGDEKGLSLINPSFIGGARHVRANHTFARVSVLGEHQPPIIEDAVLKYFLPQEELTLGLICMKISAKEDTEGGQHLPLHLLARVTHGKLGTVFESKSLAVLDKERCFSLLFKPIPDSIPNHCEVYEHHFIAPSNEACLKYMSALYILLKGSGTSLRIEKTSEKDYESRPPGPSDVGVHFVLQTSSSLVADFTKLAKSVDDRAKAYADGWRVENTNRPPQHVCAPPPPEHRVMPARAMSPSRRAASPTPSERNHSPGRNLSSPYIVRSSGRRRGDSTPDKRAPKMEPLDDDAQSSVSVAPSVVSEAGSASSRRSVSWLNRVLPEKLAARAETILSTVEKNTEFVKAIPIVGRAWMWLSPHIMPRSQEISGSYDASDLGSMTSDIANPADLDDLDTDASTPRGKRKQASSGSATAAAAAPEPSSAATAAAAIKAAGADDKEKKGSLETKEPTGVSPGVKPLTSLPAYGKSEEKAPSAATIPPAGIRRASVDTSAAASSSSSSSTAPAASTSSSSTASRPSSSYVARPGAGLSRTTSPGPRSLASPSTTARSITPSSASASAAKPAPPARDPDIEKYLSNGEDVFKYAMGNGKKSHIRVFKDSDRMTGAEKIFWCEAGARHQDRRRAMFVTSLQSVIAGKSSDVFTKFANAQSANANLCLTIASAERTLDIECESSQQRQKLVDGIRYLLQLKQQGLIK